MPHCSAMLFPSFHILCKCKRYKKPRWQNIKSNFFEKSSQEHIEIFFEHLIFLRTLYSLFIMKNAFVSYYFYTIRNSFSVLRQIYFQYPIFSKQEKAEIRNDKQSDPSDRNKQNPTTRDQKNSTSNQNSKRHRTVSESSYFSGAEASSIISGSSSLSSMSTPANTVVETYHAPDGGYGWVRQIFQQ